MKKAGAAVLVVLVLIFASTVPSDAWARGGGRFHGGFHHGGCCWWPGVAIGGLALGAALSLPFYAYAYPNAYPYPVYTPPVVAEQPPMVYQQQPAQQPLVHREVVYPNGKYVLYGDGITQAWQWLWVPAVALAPPPPAPR